MASKRESLISSAEKSLQKGKVDAALKDYLKVLEETPADINILNKVGDLNVRLGKNEDSIPFFLRIAEHYSRDGFYVRAIAMYKKINKLDPSRLDIYEKLAELYVKQQLWMEAKSNYQVLADYLLKQDNLAGAIGIYQKMVAIEPQNLQLHVKLADLFTQAKRIQEALKEYAVVAAALSERGAHEEAIRVYEKALRLAPDNVDILKTLVPLLISINSVEQARAVLRKALEASPRSVPLFLLSADAAVAANDLAEARSFSDKARAVEPENEEVLSAAVRIQLKGRRPDLAFTAAAPLADAAVRRGESKKALSLLVPIARALPDADDVIKKIVDIAAGAGDEATALPYRSALAELYRKKGKLAEAADLLRHCMRVQPDNAEFRARLAQIEPSPPIASVVPPRVPPTTLERNLEVSISGFGPGALRVPAPAPAPAPAPPPPPPAPEAEPTEFEFDLGEVESAEEASAEAPPTPPRGLGVPRVERPAGEEAVESWGTLSAAEAFAEYEEREAEAARRRDRAAETAPDEAIEELLPEAEVAAPQPAPAGFPDLALELSPPSGFGPPPSFEIPAMPGIEEPPPAEWVPAALRQDDSFPGAALEEPVSLGPVARAPTGDAALEDALIEADVFRRYGLLEKAVDQLQPLLDRDPANVRVREKVFEIHLEQGHRDVARAHAEVLASAYEAEGREDRIRGLEALLGEPLRAAAPPLPAPEAPPAALGEEAAAEPQLSPEELPGVALPSFGPAHEAEAEALEFVPEVPVEPEGAAPPPEPLPAVARVPLEDLAFEPPTEIISPDFVAAVAKALPTPVEPVEEAPAAVAGPLPEAEGEPGVAPPAGISEALSAPPSPEPAPAKPRLSAEEILGLGKPAAPAAAPAPRKPKAVRPDDLEALLGGRETKPKGKAKGAPKPEPELPADLLSALRKPPVRHVEPEPEAPSPEASLAESLEPPVEAAVPPEPTAPPRPTPEDLQELDFCLDQGMVVDAAERLQALEGRFPGDAELVARRQRLEGGRGAAEGSRAALHDILSDDLDSVLDAELGRALTEDMVRDAAPLPSAPATAAPGAPILDESGLFSDEQEFFNFADELHTELRRETELPAAEEGREVSLEEIFRDFKKGVEQQLSPEDYETHYNLGIAYKEMGLTDEAIGEFQLASKDPLHAVECCAMLGLCFLEKGLPQLAVKWYRKGLETIGIKDDDRLGLQYALAGVLEQVGDREAAYRTYLEIFGASASYRDVADRLRELKPYAAS